MNSAKSVTGSELSLAQLLAQRIVATTHADLTERALHYARAGVTDTIGVTLAGSQEDASSILTSIAAADSGPALLLGTRRRTSLLSAALTNGLSANVIDFDDCTDNLGGHPSSPVLSALLPLAEQRGSSGKDLLLAYVVGVETETQIARAVNFHHYEKGWHPTSTLGVFGAAAACSRLLGLDEHQTATALSTAASMASGIKVNFGTMVKPLHIGHAAHDGLLASLLASRGFTADMMVFEHEHGFFNVYNGKENYIYARATEKWGEPFDIEFPGLAIKQYPCCLSVQSAIDATLSLLRNHPISAERIVRVSARTAARRLKHTDNPHPQSVLQAKLSLQYCLARAILHGEVRVEHFQGSAHQDEPVKRLMQRIEVGIAEPNTEADDKALNADVTITLDDGMSFSKRLDCPIGHEPGIPLPDHLVQEKFLHCTHGILVSEKAEMVYEMLRSLDQAPDVNNIMRLIEQATMA